MPDSDDLPHNEAEEQLYIKGKTEISTTKETIGSLGPPDSPVIKEIELKIERSRFWLVLYLISIISGVLIMPFILLPFGITLEDKYWEYLHIAFPALIGVFGSAATFYFDRR
jgi:hypothetical protein